MQTALRAILRALKPSTHCLCALAFFVLAAPMCAADVLGPVISASISPATLPVTGGGITITATITDPGKRAVTSVTGTLYRGGYYVNSVALSNGGSGSVYTGTLSSNGNNTTSADYVYTATVTATNMQNVSTTAAATGDTVQAHDNMPPTLTNVSISPATLPVTGGGITITATITDPGKRAVTSVTGTLYRGGYYVNSVALSNGGSGSVYTGTLSSNGNNTTSADYVYTATVSAANDLNLSNSAAAAGNTVQAHDNMPPMLTNLSLSPASLPATGGAITITATITDPGKRAVTSVTGYLFKNGSYTGNNVALSNGGVGNIYTGNFGVGSNTGSIPYVYTASVTATNDLNLSNSAVTNGQTGQGNSGPPASLVPLLLTSDPAKPVLSPAYLPAGSPDTALTITGVNFAADALVSINGVELAASLITKSTATQITVTVPAVLLVNPGALAVSVISPSLGSLSNPVNLNVLGAEDVTTLVALNYLGQRYDRASGTYLRSYLLTNKGDRFLPGALSLVADRLTNARLSNAVGITRYKKPVGSPFVMVAAAGLAPGASATATLALAATGAGPVTYTPRILAGIGAR